MSDTEDNELTLYTYKGCPSCVEAKMELRDQLTVGEINEVDVTDNDEMMDFLTESFGGVPVLAKEKDGQICEVDIYTGDELSCVVNSVKAKMKELTD